MLEQELKLVAGDAETLDEVLRSALVRDALDDPNQADAEAIRYRGIYYDTSDGELSRQRCSLRARQEGDRLVAALKMAGEIRDGLSSRMEYETRLTDFFSTAGQLPAGEFRDRVGEKIALDTLLIARVEVDMQRRIRNLQLSDDEGVVSEVELVADDGVIHGGGLSESLREIELELKSGALEPLLKFGRALQHEFDLKPSTRTKHEIGLTLRSRANVA